MSVSQLDQVICLILAGGQGSRMRSKTLHKVCFPIAGRPAILRALDGYRAAGIGRFVVVVGAMAGQVVETVGQEAPDATFVYQPVRLGTGNAARVGLTPLQAFQYSGYVMITMGDKLFDPAAVRRFLRHAAEHDYDALVAVKPRDRRSDGGRILLRQGGSLAGIVEKRDVQKAAIMGEVWRILGEAREETAAAALATLSESVRQAFPDPVKRATALGRIDEALLHRDLGLLAACAGPAQGKVSVGGDTFTVEEVEAASLENTALYLFRATALYEGLKHITTSNAQKEEYLTDVINNLAAVGCQKPDGQPYRVGHFAVAEDDVLTFNNPEELLAAEELFRRRSLGQTAVEAAPRVIPPDSYRTAREWLELVDAGGGELRRLLRLTYGPDESLWSERLAVFRRVLARFGELHGWDRRVILVRAPGRVNLLGRHVEHRGGHINVMAISKEVVMAAAPRADDVVSIANVDELNYPEGSFRLGSELAGLSWDDWLSYINHDRVQRLVKESNGDWVNYVKAAFLRLQFGCREVQLHGMDAVFSGNIPVAAGLSSSSAIVVASAEAAVVLNGLDLEPQEFVDLCGEGEWYVGSRGGAGDHAAMKLGRLGQVIQVRFFPFQPEEGVPLPEGHRLIIANSYVQARKMTSAKDLFNQRVASYEFGLMLLKDRFPDLASKMARLRDVNPRTLGIRQGELYTMLRELPETVTASEIRRRFAGRYERELERIFNSHSDPGEYLVRSVVLFGIAECERSRVCRELLERGDVATIGALMNISHDGDRVVRFTGQGSTWAARPYDYSASDSYLAGLIDDLHSQELDRVRRAQLQFQPGGYACSTPEIDEMVDLSMQVPGVLGAQLSGAGLGGCIMVLAREGAVPALQETLASRFYAPRSLAPAFTVGAPVRGSSVISVS